MSNKILGLVFIVVLFIASCVADPNIEDPCVTDDTGDLTIVNATSGVNGVPLEIYINGTFTGTTLSPGGELYEGQLGTGSYSIEGRSSTVSFNKTVQLLQCDDLFVQLGQ
jgi:hypothetical protein